VHKIMTEYYIDWFRIGNCGQKKTSNMYILMPK
jgi:hypothetical protein